MRTLTGGLTWNTGKWASAEEHRLQTLDLILKILVPPFCWAASSWP